MLSLCEAVNIDELSDEDMHLLPYSVSKFTILHSNVVKGLDCRQTVVIGELD